MSKGKDFRAPRKRGFDDDGPMPYEPKTRTPRAFGGASDGGFGAPAMGGMAATAPAAGPTIDAVVKWFKADKGYGFVELANGQGDAFLHANALHASGHDSVPAGAKLKVLVGAGAKGAQVTRVMEVDTTGVVERPQRSFGGGDAGRGDRGRAASRPTRRRRWRSAARSSGSTTPRASASSPAMTAARTCSFTSRSSARRAFPV